MRTPTILAAVLFTACLPITARAIEALEAHGTLDSVTVYRGQALVTRLVDVPGPAGLREVIVTDLPEQVVAGSTFAEGADGIEVRSVRYRQRPMSADVREEVRKLDEQQRLIEDNLAANQQFQNVLNEQKAYLAKLEQFVAPTATVELTQGVLNADTLRALSEYLLTQRKELAEQELQLGKERRQLSQELELVNRQRAVVTGGSARTAREAVVLANLTADATTVRLFDRVPKAKDGEVKLTLVSTGRDLSDDPRYRQAQHGKGLLRWDVNVPAKAAGPQAFAVEYQLRLEYDRQMSIVGSPLAQTP
jgi:hypothetical protein